MRKSFGTLENGQTVEQFTLTDGVCSCDILTLGGIIRALRVPDRFGVLRDVVLGCDTTEDYRQQTSYFGALIGRFANRIAGAEFSLGGRQYFLAANNGKNHLHGGTVGFDRRLWKAEASSESSLTLALTSPDGEEGYPGTLLVKVTYTLAKGCLTLEYLAQTDRDTLCNLTNHSYFNLNGHSAGDVLSQELQILADEFTPVDPEGIPDGRILTVSGTPLDLRSPTQIGSRIDEDVLQLRQVGGYDHNYVLRGTGLRAAAVAYSKDSGICLKVSTTCPGLQFYSGNFISDGTHGKAGAVYQARSGFCLETQAFPDAPHHPAFPSAVLRAGEEYRETTVYRFSCLD